MSDEVESCVKQSLKKIATCDHVSHKSQHINNYWRFRAGQRLGYFPPICPVYFHMHPYIQFHMTSIIVPPITPGGGGGPHDQAATGNHNI